MALAFLAAIAATAASGQSPDCALKPNYEEFAARAIASIDDYQKLEQDFIGVNAAHTSRVYRLPPSITIPATPDNFAAKAADLQKVASERIRLMGCP